MLIDRRLVLERISGTTPASRPIQLQSNLTLVARDGTARGLSDVGSNGRAKRSAGADPFIAADVIVAKDR